MCSRPPFALLLVVAACGTIGTPGGGAQNLPSAGGGPFQALVKGQVAPQDTAPFVFLAGGQSYREPSVLSATGDPSNPGVFMYLVANGSPGDVILRTRADDSVSFYGDFADQQMNATHRPPVVLAASQAWEGKNLSGPCAVRVGSEIWLYYAGDGGIGLAKSGDGKNFTRMPTQVLAVDSGVAWESTAPHAPSVAIFPDGSWHMLYTAGNDIGEATSADGVHWTRVGDPILVPSPVVDPKTLPEGVNPPFDEGAVDDPQLAPRIDETGRLVVRVFYTGYDKPVGSASRTGSIGFAGRYGDTGALSRQPAPAYTAPGATVAGPALFDWNGTPLLYVSQLDIAGTPTFLAIAAAYDPSTGSPGMPGSFATSP